MKRNQPIFGKCSFSMLFDNGCQLMKLAIESGKKENLFIADLFTWDQISETFKSGMLHNFEEPTITAMIDYIQEN